MGANSNAKFDVCVAEYRALVRRRIERAVADAAAMKAKRDERYAARKARQR